MREKKDVFFKKKSNNLPIPGTGLNRRQTSQNIIKEYGTVLSSSINMFIRILVFFTIGIYLCTCLKSNVSAYAIGIPASESDFEMQGNSEINDVFEASKIVESIDLQNSTIMVLADPGYSSTQGMCVVGDRYVIVGRYKTDGSKDLMVYDVIGKKIMASNVFMKTEPDEPDAGRNVDLGHLNGLTYYNGYLYLPRENYKDIVRLKLNKDFSIIFDSVVYCSLDGEQTPTNISCHNGVFYWVASGRDNNGICVYCSKDDFTTTELAFSSSFNSLADRNAIVKQGMSFDGKYLFFAFTGRLNVPAIESVTDYQKLFRNTEKIIITLPDGKIVRCLTFARGSYGEIEDVDTISIDGNVYLIISCNQNDNGVACIYAVPLFKDTVSSPCLEGVNLEGCFFFDCYDYEVYCDNRYCYFDESHDYDVLRSNPFASGMTQDRFTNVYAALNYIKRLGCQAKLHLTGEYGNLVFRNLPAGISFVLDDAKIDSLSFIQCAEINLAGHNVAVLGRLYSENSIVLISDGISLKGTDSAKYAIEAHSSILTGSFADIKGYEEIINNSQSIVSIFGFDDNSSSIRYFNSESVFFPNQGLSLFEDERTNVYSVGYYNQKVKTIISQYEKTVMLNLMVNSGLLLQNTDNMNLTGILPKEFCPAEDCIFQAIIAENEDGDGLIGFCTVQITKDGQINIYADSKLLLSGTFVLVTATYIAL